MEGIWAEDYEDDDFLDYYGEAEEVPEPERKRAKIIEEESKEPKKPRIVQNPRPKLDIDRLLSSQGLPELLKMASDITFRPGREVEDMRRTLLMIQLWSHRLFTKFAFDDFIAKCEVLGKKRPVKTHLRKVRTGMIPI